MSNKNNSPTSLSVMVGSGETFEANGKTYKIMPMPLAHVVEFTKDEVPVRALPFFLTDENSKKTINKWLGEVSVELADGNVITVKYCRNKDGELMTIDKATADGWTILDLKRYLRKLCDLSG